MSESRFERTIGLIGIENLETISNKTIAIIGLGGVGGTVLETLARTGFSKFIIVDCDTVNLSNLNRQILYTQANIGQLKNEAAEERLRVINPEANIKSYNLKVNENTLDEIFANKIDMVVDAIDDVPAKIAIAKKCASNNVQLIMSLGMANRLDPSKVKIIRLDKTTNDPLAKKVRYELRHAEIDTKNIMSVCSDENPLKDGGKLHSIMTVPSSAGLHIAYYVINYFVRREK